MPETPPNPNAGRNRVPSEQELVSIRERVAQVQKVIDLNTQEAEVAMAAYEAIKIRYEAIQSELYLAKTIADSFRAAIKSLKPKLEGLQALLNPIRRYPDDILRIIFEEAVNLVLERCGQQEAMYTAVDISHVCQRWRSLALSTPILWRTFSVTIDAEVDPKRAMLSDFARRIRGKGVPANVHLYIGGSETSDAKVKQAVKNLPTALHQLRAIALLEIHVETRGGHSSVLAAIPTIEYRQMDHLSLNFYSEHLHLEVDDPSLGPFLGKFRPFRKLSILDANLTMAPTENLKRLWDNLEELKLERVGNLQVETLVMMPRLKVLNMVGCDIALAPGGIKDSHVLPELSALTTDHGGFPWFSIRCPKLRHLGLPKFPDGDNNNNELWEFLSAATLLNNVTYKGGPPRCLVGLAQAAPQITYLRLEDSFYSWKKKNPQCELEFYKVLVDWNAYGFTTPPFPLLRHMIIEPSPYLHEDVLGSIIHSRCLPREHCESTLEDAIPQPLESFEIVTKFVGGWMRNAYLNQYFSPVGHASAIKKELDEWDERQLDANYGISSGRITVAKPFVYRLLGGRVSQRYCK